MSALQSGAHALIGPVVLIGLAGFAAWLFIATIIGSSLKAQPRLAWALFWLSKTWIPLLVVVWGLDSASQGRSVIAVGMLIAAALFAAAGLTEGVVSRATSGVGGVLLLALMTWCSRLDHDSMQTILGAVMCVGVVIALLIGWLRAAWKPKPHGDAAA